MSANALGGSRFGVQEALAREADRRLLSDIELKGLQDAYTQLFQSKMCNSSYLHAHLIPH